MKLTPSVQLEFGKLSDRVRGTVQYRISPFEQRAFAGALSKGLVNSVRRISTALVTVGPFFAVSYLIFSEVEKGYQRSLRKNPQDYVNDK